MGVWCRPSILHSHSKLVVLWRGFNLSGANRRWLTGSLAPLISLKTRPATGPSAHGSTALTNPHPTCPFANWVVACTASLTFTVRDQRDAPGIRDDTMPLRVVIFRGPVPSTTCERSAFGAIYVFRPAPLLASHRAARFMLYHTALGTHHLQVTKAMGRSCRAPWG